VLTCTVNLVDNSMTNQDVLEKALDEMMSEFQKASSGLMEVTHTGKFEYSKVHYGVFYVKPSRRLAATLGVDREIVVVLNRFKDQQARTIDATKAMIDGIGVRLESTVAMIVHRDAKGSHKLKNWGRECGLSVIPIYFGKDSLPRGSQFEALLCNELFSHDPFDVTGPVADDTNFFGRRTEAQDLARKLQSGQIRSCFGIRKIGKTSIVNRVVKECEQSYQCLCVILDCSRDEIWALTATSLLESLSSSIEEALSSKQRYVQVKPISATHDRTQTNNRLFEVIGQSKMSIILFMDEVDYIGPGSPTANHWQQEFNPFWRTIRAIYQESARTGKNFSIFVSGVSSKWFSVESVDGVENSALALVPEEYLSPLPRGASIAMIKTMAIRAGFRFADSDAELIAQACSDIPYWIRKACSYIHRQVPVASRPIEFEEAELNKHLEAFFQSEGAPLASVALRHLFRVYPELEEVCVRCSPGSIPAADLPRHLSSTLQKYGILSLINGTYALSGPMMRGGFAWFLEAKDQAWTPKVDPLNSPTNESNLYEAWADELVTISRRRNILEKRLRELIVDFIKLDSLRNKDKGIVQQRILAAIPKERREKISNKSAHLLMQTFYWLDLCQVIVKEWDLFSPLFGDQNNFKLNYMIINERPDAHAKDLTAADVALHGRALTWMEEKILSD
jgi:hypothetical protein